MTAQLGFVLGFPVILVIAYTVTDVSAVVASTLGQPMGALCLQVLGHKAGLAMFAINILAQYAVELGCIIAGSRVICMSCLGSECGLLGLAAVSVWFGCGTHHAAIHTKPHHLLVYSSDLTHSLCPTSSHIVALADILDFQMPIAETTYCPAAGGGSR